MRRVDDDFEVGYLILPLPLLWPSKRSSEKPAAEIGYEYLGKPPIKAPIEQCKAEPMVAKKMT